MEALTYKLRLLDKKVRTSLAKAKGGERFTPVRMYVGICPKIGMAGGSYLPRLELTRSIALGLASAAPKCIVFVETSEQRARRNTLR
jgi:hypothetical protein